MLSTQFDGLLSHQHIVIFSLYRGAWCPFCIQYLKALNKAKKQLNRSDVAFYGVSTQGDDINQKLQQKLKLDFDILNDEERFFNSQYDVPLGNKASHPNYLQPAIFIFKQQELVYSWVQNPKLLNFQGAINRLSVKDVIKELERL